MAPLPRPAERAPRPATGELAKATIIDTTTGTAVAVMYNPEELKFDQGNVFAEVAIPGLNAPPVQYVRGKARSLSMELFFDTYETARDVREHTAPITALLERRPQTLAPPVLIFSLGRVQFRCVLVEAGLRFTMFLRDGTPVRSTMSVRFQEYVDVGIDIQQGLFLGSPTVSAAVNRAADLVVAAATGSGSVHVTVDGETLSGLAAIYLGDAGRWRTIAQANRIDDPFDLPAGTTLVIPPAGGAR
jgi:hypothetical protein